MTWTGCDADRRLDYENAEEFELNASDRLWVWPDGSIEIKAYQTWTDDDEPTLTVLNPEQVDEVFAAVMRAKGIA